MLDPPGRKDIKQVELYTKFRKYIPLQWQEETCPRPDEVVLDKFKIEKKEKVRSHLEKKKEQQKKHLEDIAKRAATSAISVFKSKAQAQFPPILTHDIVPPDTTEDKDHNNDTEKNMNDTPNVFEA